LDLLIYSYEGSFIYIIVVSIANLFKVVNPGREFWISHLETFLSNFCGFDTCGCAYVLISILAGFICFGNGSYRFLICPIFYDLILAPVTKKS
jgi:hypothetical protein